MRLPLSRCPLREVLSVTASQHPSRAARAAVHAESYPVEHVASGRYGALRLGAMALAHANRSVSRRWSTYSAKLWKGGGNGLRISRKSPLGVNAILSYASRIISPSAVRNSVFS